MTAKIWTFGIFYIFLGAPIIQWLSTGQGEIRSFQYMLFPAIIFLFIKKSFLTREIPKQIILSLWFFILILYLSCSYSKFYAIELSGIDFSIFDWMMHNTAHGKFGYSPIYDVNHFGVHTSWILLPLIPLHSFCAHPLFLLSIGSISMWLAAHPLWLIGKINHLRDSENLILCSAYLMSSFSATVVSDGFRIESFIPACFFYFLYYRQKKFLWSSLIFSALLCCIKEDLSIYIMALAAASFIFQEQRKHSSYIFTVSAVIFIFNIFIAQPKLLENYTYLPSYLKFWHHYGTDMKSILTGMFSSPSQVAKDMVSSGWWKIYAPLALLPLRSPLFILASLPGLFLLGTASQHKTMHDFSSYYPLALVCIALYSMAAIHKNLNSRVKSIWLLSLLIFPLCHSGWLKFYNYDSNTLSYLAQAKSYLETHHKDQPICAQVIAFPHLGYRLKLYPLDEKCLKREYAILLTVKNKSSYPYQNHEIERFGKNQTKRFGNIILSDSKTSNHLSIPH